MSGHRSGRSRYRPLAPLVAFDLDGTLVDLRAVYVRAHQLTAREVLGIELEEERVLQLMSGGLPIRAHMAALDEGAADKLVEVFVERYRGVREGLAQAFPGIAQLVTGLRESGFEIAVVTSKLREDALAELLATELDRSVDVLVAFEDTTEHKPDAAPFLEAIRRLGTRSGIAVGDLPTDVAAARAAGLEAIGVSWGYGTSESLLDAGALCVYETVAELELGLRRMLAYGGGQEQAPVVDT